MFGVVVQCDWVFVFGVDVVLSVDNQYFFVGEFVGVLVYFGVLCYVEQVVVGRFYQYLWGQWQSVLWFCCVGDYCIKCVVLWGENFFNGYCYCSVQ